jgi:hypothetical protein
MAAARGLSVRRVDQAMGMDELTNNGCVQHVRLEHGREKKFIGAE